MSKPESRGPGRAPMPKVKVNAFFHHLGRTGSVTVAAERAQLRRSSRSTRGARTTRNSPSAGLRRSISASSACRTTP